MSIETEKKSTKEKFSSFMHSTVDLGKKAASGTKTSVMNMVEKAKNDSRTRQIKKLNPLTRKEYKSKDFKIPNIIKIVDDAVRRDNELCEGAIGWRSQDTGAEILYLYDEFVNDSKLQFIPNAQCDAIYCVDCHDRNRFIRTDCIFTITSDERMAELKHIAYCLGAKRYTIRITETKLNEQTTHKTKSLNIKAKGSNGEVKSEQHETQMMETKAESFAEAEYKDSRECQRPTLKWFGHDGSIKELVENCCAGKNELTRTTIKISGSTTTTMSQATASAIDGAIGISKIKGAMSMSEKVNQEQNSTLELYIEF